MYIDDFIFDSNPSTNEIIKQYLSFAYISPLRAYHCWDHVLYCLDKLHPENHSSEDLKDIVFAICYHDFFYIPNYELNETTSATVFTYDAQAFKYDCDIQNVVDAIHATKPCQDLSSFSLTSQIVSDLDKYILSDIDEYNTYTRRLSYECTFIPLNQYKKLRLNFLQELLKYPIYYSPLYKHLESHARDNITQEINSIMSF